MTAIQFERATGRLRLPVREFAELVQQSAPGARHTAGLVASGVLSEQGPHPLLKPGLAAVRAPVCEVDVRVTGAAGTQTHRGWVAPEAAAFLLQVRGDTYEFLTAGPSFVPAAIARVLRLQPRPTLDLGPVSTPGQIIDDLLGDDAPLRKHAVATLAEATSEHAALAADGWRASRTLVTWPGSDGAPTGRDLTLFDHPTGVLVASRGDDSTTAVWSSTGGATIWRLLVELLPGDEELGADPQDA